MKQVEGVLEVIAEVLLKCVVMSMVVLIFWWVVLTWFGDIAYRTHSSFIPLSREAFYSIHYTCFLIT